MSRTEHTEDAVFFGGGRYLYVDAKCPLSRTEDAEDAEFFGGSGLYLSVDAR